MHNSLIDKLDTSGSVGNHPFVRQNKLGSCLHRLALSERVRGGLILIVPSQLIVDVAQFLVSFELAIRIMHAGYGSPCFTMFLPYKRMNSQRPRGVELVYCA